MHVSDNELRVKDALTIRSLTSPDTKIAVAWAGSIPYFSDRTMIDLLGKCDVFYCAPEHASIRLFCTWLSFFLG
jgi:hypothetical protein